MTGNTGHDDEQRVESPCINECVNVDGTCLGCGRTVAEIASWGTMSDEERAAVLERIDAE